VDFHSIIECCSTLGNDLVAGLEALEDLHRIASAVTRRNIDALCYPFAHNE
jgi:hypothetical protein